MRRLALVILFIFLTTINIPASGAVDIKDSLKQRLRDSTNQESRILQEILQLDARLHKAAMASAEIEQRLLAIQEELREALDARGQAEAALAAGRQEFSRSLRFFYTYGFSPFITAALFSDDWTEFFIRRELLHYLSEHFLGIVRHNLALARETRQKSELALAKEKELQQARAESQSARQTLAALKAEQEKKLASLRQQNTVLSRDLLALEKAWSGALPTLHYLLQQLPSLPWQQLRPDNIQVDIIRGRVLATFTQQNLNSTLMASREQLQDVQLVLPGQILKIPGPDFEVQGTLRVYGPRQLLFVPREVAFAGLPLDPATWTQLLPAEKLVLNLPPPDYNLKFKDIFLEPGKMVLELER